MTPEEKTAAAQKLQEELEVARKTFTGWPDSSVQSYRVQYVTDTGGLRHVDVEAATGNEAAEKALATFGGGKITNITPAPKQKAKAAA